MHKDKHWLNSNHQATDDCLATLDVPDGYNNILVIFISNRLEREELCYIQLAHKGELLPVPCMYTIPSL